MGSPEVPDVNSSCAIWSGRGRGAATAASPAGRVAVQHDHVLERRQLRPQPGGHRGVVAAPERAGHEQHAGAALAEHERQLALAEDRHQRLAHGAEAQRGQRDRHEINLVR